MKRGSDKKVPEYQSPDDQRSNPTSSKKKISDRLIESSPSPKIFENLQEETGRNLKNQQIIKQFVKIASRSARYKLINGFTQLKINYLSTTLNNYKSIKLIDITKKIIFRWKVKVWNSFIQHKNCFKRNLQATKRIIFIISGLNVRLKRLAIIKMRGNALISASEERSIRSIQTPLKSGSKMEGINSSLSLRSNTDGNLTDGMLLEKMILSQEVLIPLKKLLRYDKKTFWIISTSEVKDAAENQKRRLLSIKNSDRNLKGKQFDNEILINVLINQIRALIETHQEKQHFQRKSISLNQKVSTNIVTVEREDQPKGGSFNLGLARRYQLATKQIQTSDQEIRIILEAQTTDYDKLVRILRQQVQKFKKNRNDKLILSRIRLSEIIINLIANLSSGESNMSQKPYHHYVEIINELVSKVKELSAVCEQIPQLQTFKRTLDLSQVSHEQYFIKIVDVLIALHHRINQLLKLRPQDMLSYIDMVRAQCHNIEIITDQFIQNVDNDVEQLNPILFTLKKGSYPEQFNPVYKNISMISKLLIKERNYSFKSQEIIERLKIVVEIYWNVLSGLKSFERQWKIAKENNQVSQVQKQVITILDECLDIFYNRLQISQRKVQDMEDMFERKRNQTSLYHQKLQSEINSLLADFQNTTIKNQELATVVDRLMTQKADLQQQIKELQKLINNNRKNNQKKGDEQLQKLLNENQQQKIYISQLEGQLKRLTRESQAVFKDKMLQYEKVISSMKIQVQHYEQQKQLMRKKIEQLSQKTITAIQQIQEKNFQIQTINTRYEVIKKQSQEQSSRFRAAIRELQNKNAELQSQNKLLQNQNALAQRNHRKIMQKFQEANQRMTQSIQAVEQQYLAEISRLTKQLQIQRSHSEVRSPTHSPSIQENQNFKKNFTNKEKQLIDLQKQFYQLNNSYQIKNQKINSLNQYINNLQQQLSQFNQQISKLQATINVSKQTQLIQKKQLIRLREQNSQLRSKFQGGLIHSKSGQSSKSINYNGQHQKQIKQLQLKLMKSNQQVISLKMKINQFCQANQAELTSLLQQLKRLQIKQNDLQTIRLNNEGTIKRLSSQIQQVNQQSNKNSLTNILQEQIKTLNLKVNEITIMKKQNESFKIKFMKDQAYILYLEEQVKSLEDIINVISSQQQILSQKYSQLMLTRLNSGTKNENMSNNLQIKQLKSEIEQLKKIRVSQQREQRVITTITVDQLGAQKSLQSQNIQGLKREINELNNIINQYSINQSNFTIKEQNYINEINLMREQLDNIVRSRQRQVQKIDDSNIKVAGQTLQELINRVDRGNQSVLSKINEIVRENSITVNLNRTITPELRKQVQVFISKNQALVDLTVTLIKQRQQLLTILRVYPNPDHLTQFLFRTLLGFSLTPQGSIEANKIIETLWMIRQTRRGPEYFMALEDYTRQFFQHQIIPKYSSPSELERHAGIVVRSRIFDEQHSHSDLK